MHHKRKETLPFATTWMELEVFAISVKMITFVQFNGE